MSTAPADRQQPPRYEIRVKGYLGQRWAAWFDGLTLTTDADGTTVIAGPVVDQAALHGLLQRVRDVGLPLVSVTPLDPDQPRTSTHPADHTEGDRHERHRGAAPAV